jgi:DNA-binding transcriptional MerR regulator
MALTIGQLAKSAGVGARTIRFYEAAGVLPAPPRATSGYRQYTMEAVHQLVFVRRARALGLSLRHLKTLLGALDGGAQGPVRPRVRQVVRAHLSTVQEQLRDLRVLEQQLERVLRRMQAPSRTRARPCRCLELDDTPARPGRRDARGR